MMATFASFLLALFLTVVMTPMISRLAAWAEIYDYPGPRKVHQWPVPRIGGLAMAVGIFVSIVLWVPLEPMIRAYLLGAAVLVAFGIVDDWRGLSFKAKFVAQIIAALVAIFYGGVRIVELGSLLPVGVMLPDWISIALTLITVVGVTNAINLADGLDGLAGGICLLSFCCIGYLAWVGQNFIVLVPVMALAGAIVGFLRFNTFPATLFMGDTGSMLLGFSAIFFSLALTQGETALSPLLPLIILGFPVLDTITVMAARIAKGLSPFEADKRHFHHRLMGMGLFHTESVFAIYVIQSLLIVSAIVVRYQSDWLLLAGYIVFAGIVLAFFYWAAITGWKLQRFDFVDRVVKGRLRDLRERGVFIRVGFQAVEWGVPMLLLATCFLPEDIPAYYSVFAAVLLTGLVLAWFFKRDRFKDAFIISFYMFTPALVYLGDASAWLQKPLMYLYHLSFLVFVFLCMAILRLTRRKKGFKLTTMDFLVLFIALVLMILPDLRHVYGLTVVKTIAIYFCYEIVLGEAREEIGKVGSLTALAYLIVVVRGLVG